MTNRKKHKLLKRCFNIVISIFTKVVKMLCRLIFVLSIMSIAGIVLGSILALVVTIVVLTDNPAVSIMESFGEFYVKNFVLMLKIYGGIVIVLLMLFPINWFFDD